MKLLKFGIFAIMLLMGGMYLLAPVSWNEKESAWMISTEKVMNKPVCEVYDYLSNVDLVADWSFFVQKIAPLNADKYSENAVGARRICYVKEHRPGISWEEEMLINNSCALRRLSVEKLIGFPTTADILFTDQIYEKVNTNSSKLELVFYLQPKTTWDYMKFVFFSPYISGIFSKNLKGIKEQVESSKA